MMRLAALLLWLLSPALALAQPYPALFDVTGVASDDVLNIREAPDTGSAILGSFDPVQGNIEVLRTTADGRWGLVRHGEGSGWTAMRYLARQPGQDGTAFPKPLFCSGTEPFWNALIGTGPVLRFDVMSEGPQVLSDQRLAQSAGRPDKYAATWKAPGTRVTAVVTRAACNDGMSDREFGFSADFTVFPAVGPGRLFSGCCSLAAN